ncbi:hypothetical protein M5J15_03460 [Serratia symbiotica]|nr:hypothetical protein M5J15_03460 [Serratia symbiotica]
MANLISEDKYTAFGNDLNDYLVLDNAETSVFIGSRDDYQSANYYATMDYIPTIIDLLESNKLSLEQYSHAAS